MRLVNLFPRFNHVIPLPHGLRNPATNAAKESSRPISSKSLVEYLDKFIIGQSSAKRSLAIALIDRSRRMRVDDENVRNAIIPSNILLVGPTGCGKTELARRLAKMVDAPFVKVVATKYSEVGFVGEDTSSMIEELAEQAYLDEARKLQAEVSEIARNFALQAVSLSLANSPIGLRDRITLDSAKDMINSGVVDSLEIEVESSMLDTPLNVRSERRAANLTEFAHVKSSTTEDIRDAIPLPNSRTTPIHSFRSISLSSLFQPRGTNLLNKAPSPSGSFRSHQQTTTVIPPPPPRPVYRSITVAHAMKIITERSSHMLTKNREQDLKERAKSAVEERGIVFIDEFDKMIAGANDEGSSFSQKRKGVEKELLTLVEGTSVNTKKLGPINTDHVVFICTGAFSSVSPKQIMPELQGRLPIRCTMNSLTLEDFVNILENVEYSLLETQRSLLMVENVELVFEKSGVLEIAHMAVEMNRETANTGARRLNTIVSIVLEDVKFNAHELTGKQIVIDQDFVRNRMHSTMKSFTQEDLRKFVL